MLRERAIPWPEVLRALEVVAMPDVTPSSVSFAGSDGKVTVQVSAPDYRAVLAYIEALNGPNPAGADVRFTLQQARLDAASSRVDATLVAERVPLFR
jgi:hypothetical protein